MARVAQPSLRGRVSLLGVAVIGGWLFLLAAGFDIVLSLRLDQQVDDALTVRAQAASATVRIADDRIVGVGESSTDAVLDSSTWIYRGRTAVERPRVARDLQRAADSLARGDKAFNDRDGYRFLALPISSGGSRIGTVVAAVDLSPYERTRTTAIIGSVVVAVLLLAGVYLALRYVLGSALHPVEAMSQQAAEWGSAEPGRRFGEGQRYAELRTLAANFDALLGRLGASLRHERHLSAELSHELRTPLARMTTQLDLLDAPEELADDVAALRSHCAAMERIIDSLLTAARTELGAGGGRSELAPVLAAVVDDAQAPHDVTVSVEPTDLVVGVDADVVERILVPLLDNACRWATTRIGVAARRGAGTVVIAVSNDGRPIAPDEAEQIFTPGFRGRPGDHATEHDGAGLGLALARRLARAADGDVTVAGGNTHTVFEVSLPVA